MYIYRTKPPDGTAFSEIFFFYAQAFPKILFLHNLYKERKEMLAMFWKNRFSAAEASSAVVCSGRGISIAVLDTGISPVADFIEPNNRIVAFLDLVNGRTEPYDDNGHGTQLTGTFSAISSFSSTYR